MTVTAIEQYTKDKYKIYLNDAFAFVLYKGDLRHYDISEGKECSEEDLAKIREEVLLKRAKMRAMHLLQSRDYTEEGMRRKLKDALYPAEIIEEAIDYVKHFHYIDDKRYALSYIESHFSTLSQKQITEKLRTKGIRPDVISASFDSYEDENGLDREEAEQKLLLQSMQKKMQSMGFFETKDPGIDTDPSALFKERQKLFSYFYRRGFSLAAIERAYSSLMGE